MYLTQVERIEAVKKVDLGKKFVYFERVQKTLEVAFMSWKNAILYGVKGHAKTDGATEFFHQLGIDPYITFFHSETDVEDDIFGGYDIPHYKKTGEKLYVFDRSIFAHEYVIIDEGFDAPSFVWEAMKSPLMSGYVTINGQNYKSKIKMIIMCTNLSPQDFAEDKSLDAVNDRFLCKAPVAFPGYEAEHYSALFQKVFGEPHTALAEAIAQVTASGKENFISPRSAVEAVKFVKVRNDVEDLIAMEEFNEDQIEFLKRKMEDALLIEKFEKIKEDYAELVNTPVVDKDDATEKLEYLEVLLTDIFSFRAPESITDERKEFAKKMMEKKKYLNTRVDKKKGRSMSSREQKRMISERSATVVESNTKSAKAQNRDARHGKFGKSPIKPVAG